VVAMPVWGVTPVAARAGPVVVVATAAVKEAWAVVVAGVAVGVRLDPQAVSSAAPSRVATTVGLLTAVRIMFS